MAVLTAQQIARVAIALLSRRLVLPRTFTQIPGEAFSGDNGDTITVRVPQPGAARTQATPNAVITFDDVNEIPVDVSLTHLYHAKRVSDEEATLDLVDYARQVLRVQVDAVARGAEDQAYDAINNLVADGGIEFAASATDEDTKGVILELRQALSEADVPPEDRFLAVAPDIATRFLSVDDFVRADQSGGTDALRNAVIGRLFGFTVVEANGLDAGTAAAYHRSGAVWANRAPVNVNAAGAESAIVTEQGISLRTVRMFVPDRLSMASVVSTFAGAAVVIDEDSPLEHPRMIKVGTST